MLSFEDIKNRRPQKDALSEAPYFMYQTLNYRMKIQVLNWGNCLLQSRTELAGFGLSWNRNSRHGPKIEALLTLGIEHAAIVSASEGSKYLIYGWLQPIATQDSKDGKLKIDDALVTLIFKMRQWRCALLFCLWRLPICWLCIPATKSHFNYHAYKTTNHWCSVDAHFNVLVIQNLLPAITAFIIICNDGLHFCLIKTRPFGKAKSSNILAVVTLILLKFTNLAK